MLFAKPPTTHRHAMGTANRVKTPLAWALAGIAGGLTACAAPDLRAPNLAVIAAEAAERSASQSASLDAPAGTVGGALDRLNADPMAQERRLRARPNQPSAAALGEFVGDYTCDWRNVSIGRMAMGLRMLDGGNLRHLDPEADSVVNAFVGDGPTGSARVVFNQRGIGADITINGQALTRCVLTHDWPMAAFSATGHAPAWLLKSDAQLTQFTIADKLYAARHTDVHTLALAKPMRVGPEPDAPEVNVLHQLCHDQRSGMPFPFTVEVVHGGRLVTGCGGESGALLVGRTWTVTGVSAPPAGNARTAKLPVLPLAQAATLQFDGKGQVSGSAQCNLFSGAYTLNAAGLSIGRVVVTKRACLGRAMQEEQLFLRTLQAVKAFDVSATGELNLLTNAVADPTARTGIWAR